MLQTLPRYLGGLRGSCARMTLVVGALAGADVTHAQVVHSHSLSSAVPGTTSAAATPLSFQSTLVRYKPMTDQKLESWRDANDTVTRIGGWRTYLKEAQTPDSNAVAPTVAPATPAAPASPAAPNPHAGHGAKR